MNETQYRGQVVKISEYCGVEAHFHNLYSIGSDKDFPDLLIIKRPRLIVAELKVKAKFEPGQIRWLELFAGCTSIESYKWRSGETPIEEIAEIFRR